MSKPGSAPTRGLLYRPQFVSKLRRQRLLDELQTFRPIWEDRYSEHNPAPEGKQGRKLLRPVYWLGNWQFACLNYYHPPKGIEFRCVRAEPFPDEMAQMVREIEALTRDSIEAGDIPRGWHLNTCLVNYYGSQIDDSGRHLDVARVGEHKDFEPGPVASVSLGERALFQFVTSPGKHVRSQVVLQQWLEDSSLQVFAGERFKKKLFHRVQRVEKKRPEIFEMNTTNFETRRINFTFRYVPLEHIRDLRHFPAEKKSDVAPYVRVLAQGSEFFSAILVEL